ncbi:hypothetical protein QK290_17365 [Pseudarthrobacter sp. AL07]|uniref:hypothetical protein n=1 Tax=unclassified Pseudarthrobacter TaxID=2647000 RepID=UPI00249A3D2B|nr:MULTISPECIES: hypothetical protein [unclassified Pseudarthrobacter]MDI3196162.1 hypothetical protein [Pseudarthrobacter sp. AL20]MDI3210226.1 hypothetical protein [Pseudarthrobacter sp. AL07]
METLKKILRNQYFPAAAVLTAVLLFWMIAMFGGLSLLNNNQPPMATLTWMLFVYAAAVLTPLAGVLAAVDLVRRWRRNRMYAAIDITQSAEPEAPKQSAPKQPAQHRPVTQQQPVKRHPVQQQPGKKQPAQTTQRKKAA